MKRFCILLAGSWLLGCGSVIEKKILQEKDYVTWQRDLAARFDREGDNVALLRQLIDIAYINEDFATVLKQVAAHRKLTGTSEPDLALIEIHTLRHMFRLDECLQKLSEFAAKYPRSAEAAVLLKQKPVIELSRTLPPPLAVSPYLEGKKNGVTRMELMQAPELALRISDEEAEWFDWRKNAAVPKKFWETTKTPLGNAHEQELDILHFPSASDYGRTSEPALPLLRRESARTTLVHSDRREERLNFLDEDCGLPAMSPWGNYFVASCRRNGHFDLLLFTLQDGRWVERSLTELNTGFDEMAPRISADGQYLFFASDGHPGYGGLDFFYASIRHEMLCKSSPCQHVMRFSPAVNFGPQVNTYHNESVALQLSALAKAVHFSAQGKKDGLTGKAAIPGAIRLSETLSYRFVAYHGTTSGERLVTITPKKGDSRPPTTYRSGAQADWIRFIAGAEYEIQFAGPASTTLRYSLRVPAMRENYGLNFVIERFSYENSPQAVRMTYAEGASGVTQDLRPEVERVAEQLKADRRLNVLIEGHTDNIGGEAYNSALSYRRADAIKRQLVGVGIAPERITARGWGELRPLNQNLTAEERAANRRVEILLVP